VHSIARLALLQQEESFMMMHPFTWFCLLLGKISIARAIVFILWIGKIKTAAKKLRFLS